MHPTLRIIESEHRSISAVLDGLSHFIDQGLADTAMPDPRVFRAMLQYLDLFAERVHHPREDMYLFSRLRRRTREADAVLEDLQADHFQGLGAMRAVEQAFLRYEEGGEPFFDAFARAAQDYSAFYRRHMQIEEKTIFPLAEQVLTEVDWQYIGSAFATHHDPLASAQDELDLKTLFTRIVTITPSPVGVGPSLARETGTSP